MKSTLKIYALFILIFTQSCKENPCEDILCFTPPSPFQFELVDKFSGENLFTNETFNPSDIQIINLDTQNSVAFTFIDENNYNIISINSIGWETEIINYSIQILSESIFELYVDAERMNENCCSFTRYNEIKIKNTEFELTQNNESYKILVE